MPGVASPHGDPDPGGRILAALRTVEPAVPPDAEVMLRQAVEPRWDSCDARVGTVGWDDVTVAVQFRTGGPPEAVIARADAVLAAAGWHRTQAFGSPLGPGMRWARTVAGSTSATATLAPGTNGALTYWDLDAVAPPHGPRVSGC